MLTVTAAAKECLLTRLHKRKAAGDMALRFTRREGGWRLRLDRAGPQDTAISHEGRSVLLLDETVSKAMAHLKLDAHQDGTRLKLGRIHDVTE